MSNYQVSEVAEVAVERWLVDHASDGKYPDALTKLTDLINETWSSGGMPTMQALRNDIVEYNEVNV